MSDADRTAICNIISDMLDDPDEHGIYHTSTAYTRLEHYIEGVRAEAIGWAHADACVTMDNGGDPRLTEVPDMLRRAQVDLGLSQSKGTEGRMLWWVERTIRPGTLPATAGKLWSRLKEVFWMAV